MVIQAITEQNVDLALECYNDAKSLPHTATVLELKLNGYALNGSWGYNEKITIAYDLRQRIFLMKELMGNEVSRIQDFAREFGANTHDNLTSFTIVVAHARHFMFMPLYVGTLEGVPVESVNIDLGRKIFAQMSSVLTFLHSFKFAHMDVKPSNICLDSEGNLILIDLGSIQKFGSFTETTQVFVPSDLVSTNPSSGNRYSSNAKHDWWMLAMTIADKAYVQPIGYGTFSMSTFDLRRLLESDLPDLLDLLES